MASVAEAQGIATIISDHNVRETLRVTDEVYIISEGKILRHGPPADLAAADDVRRIYLGEEFVLESGMLEPCLHR